MKKSIISSFLIFSFLLMSCSASKHVGITYITKPPKEETNEAIWLIYWQDQFDAFKGNVVAPDSREYNPNAVNAFQRAKMEWDDKVITASFNNSLILWGSIIGGSILFTVITLSSIGK
ncbi:MAG: hypothetical protein FJW56_06645 [Actinobacteria bacterium]|nr:hypothetical protein [Actinomycetota bacterium]